jgi:hypothetical protein
MNDFQKVLVVDSGDRLAEDVFSAQLAEFGFSSVTTSYEAAEDVLGLIRTPSAIVLNMSRADASADYDRFVAVATALKTRETALGIPVILWDRSREVEAGGLSGILADAFGRPISVPAA